MSDGVEEKKREGESNPERSPACPDEYSRAVAKVAVAQVCEGIGFESVKASALDALSDIAVRYMCDLAESARYYANLASRSETNVFDVVKGLEDLSAAHGFMGASGFDCCSSSSGALKELRDYFVTVEEIPFAQPIPHFPISKSTSSSAQIQSSSDLEEVRSRKHIPEWLPEFPEPHTYLHSPVWNERRADSQRGNTEHVRQRRKAESSLLRLQQRLLASVSAPSGSANGVVEGSEAMEEGNLFLAPPFQAGEKEVSQVSVPTKLVITEPNKKKHGSFVEIFAPAIDAVRCEEVDSMDVDDRGLAFAKRPVIRFRLKTGNKMRGEDVDVSLRGRGEERVPALAMDEERDEKKRRAEQILRQSMASAQETGHSVN